MPFPMSIASLAAALITSASAAEPAPESPLADLGLSVEMGPRLLAGSNARAFEAGPAPRLVANVANQHTYVVQVAYGYSWHRLTDASILVRGDSDLGAATGSAQLHTAVVGAKVYPLVADQATAEQRRLQPYVSSSVGVVVTVGTIDLADIGLTTTTVRPHLEAELALGIDFALSERITLGTVVRAAALPGLRDQGAGNPARLEVLWMLEPGLVTGVAF